MASTVAGHPPLTIFSEEEELFRESVAGFAAREVKPRVQEMERAGKIDPALTKQFFEMGLMGLEVGEEYGGAGYFIGAAEPGRAGALARSARAPRRTSHNG